MSIQSSINATIGALTGAAIVAKKSAMDKAKAAQAQLEKEKKLQLKRSEAAAKLAQARVEQDQQEKQKQREDIVKRIKKYGKEAPVDIPRLGKEAQTIFVKDFLKQENLTPAQALEKLGVNNGKK
jgi:hypothetical protein|nr:MAG TPA: hypothetical protein [Bacteriophage sp.]